MISLKEFIESVDSNVSRKLLVSNSSSNENLATKTDFEEALDNTQKVKIDNKAKKKFAENIIKTVQDEVFISELSERVGTPQDNESEDEFANRATNILKNMLNKKFKIE